jgi:hypothetical protein
MAHQNGAGPGSAATDPGARKIDQLGGKVDFLATLNRKPFQAICAELAGSTRCTAKGITANSSSPVLSLCRQLVLAGHDPARPLHAYRDETLCLIVSSIGEAASLEINGEGTGFRPAREPDAAAPMRSFRQGATQRRRPQSGHGVTTVSVQRGAS